MPNKTPIRIERKSVWQIIRDLEAAKYALPRLQREFVWDGNRAAKLLDSIDRGIPIGSLLIWETTSARADWLRHSDQDLLPGFNRLNPKVRVIIDGQQRLTVLYQAYRGETKPNAMGREVNFKRVVLALREEDRAEVRFRYRSEQTRAFISVPSILSSMWGSNCRGLGLTKRQIALVRQTRERLRSYPLHLVLFGTASMDDVADCFRRINTGGKRLSTSDELLSDAQRFSLRDHVRSLQRSLEGLSRTDENILLHGFCFASGKSRVDKTVAQRVIKEMNLEVSSNGRAETDFDDRWNQFSRAVQKSVNLLRKEFNVFNEGFLPSENMLTTLPCFFFFNGQQDPSSHQLTRIRQWFWATAVGNRYTGSGYRRNIESDVVFFKALAERPSTKFEFRPSTSLDDLKRTAFTGKRSLARAVFCLLAGEAPLNLKTGYQISVDVVSGLADSKNKHHIFPKALLREVNVAQRGINSIVNICFLPRDLNIEIGKNAPHHYLADFGPRKDLPLRLRSHLIPGSIRDPLNHRHITTIFRTFLDDRSALLAASLEKEAGMKLFTKGSF